MNVLERFLHWWFAELGALVPRIGVRDVLVATHDGDAVQLGLQRRGTMRRLGALATLEPRMQRRFRRAVRTGRVQVALLLPQDQVLRQQVRLPVAAAKDLDNVLRFELERVTPFHSSEIFATHTARPVKPGDPQVTVDLVFTPRAGVQPVMQALADAGLPVSMLDVPDADGAPAGLNLLPNASTGQWTAGRRLAAGLAGLALVLAGAWVWTVLSAQSARIAELQQVLQSERRALIAEQDGIAAAGNSARQSAKQAAHRLRSQTPMTVALVDAVARTLPDDTWLERFTLRGTEVELIGISADPTALIALFSRHALFAEPEFRTPLTRTRDGAGERFVLGLTLRGDGGDAQ